MIYLLDTSTQIYTIANLKVPVLYMVALSELKLNVNSKHDEVVLYQKLLCCMLESFPISGGTRKYSLRICHRFSA